MSNSRYLQNIESKLQLAQSHEAMLALKAEVASYYARRGDIAPAKLLVADLRSNGGSRLDGRATAWLNISEGLIEHYSGRQHAAKDKWVRAKAIAESIDCSELASLAAAWLSFSAYLSEDLGRLRAAALSAIDLVDSRNAKSLSRLCLTLALCFHYVGDVDAAVKNYTRARISFLHEGDEVGVAALIHDMAWMAATRTRNMDLASRYGIEIMPISLQSSAESACSYENMVGVSASPSLGPLLLAQVDINESRWSYAISHINEGLDDSAKDGFSRLTPGLLADRSYCHAQLGLGREARDDMSRCLLVMVGAELHGDDHAVLLSRIEQVCGLLGMLEDQQLYVSQAKMAWERVSSFQSDLHKLAKDLDQRLDERIV